VDAEVARHILSQCLLGIAAHKTRIMATHNLHFVRHADHIVAMAGGRITEQGTFDALMGAGGAFAALATEYAGASAHSSSANHMADAATPTQPAELTAVGHKAAKLMTKEERSTGLVDTSVYGSYVKAAGGWPVVALLVAALFLWQLFKAL
jgi:ATP-binding cassette subfamily C (CFTR/MRP) protein 1